MEQDYPVTRTQATKWLRMGNRLEVSIQGERTVEVMVAYSYGPRKISCRMWSSGVWWTTLSWNQLLGFIRRNYVRSYLDLVPIG